MKKLVVLSVIIIGMSFALSACNQKGSMQTAGEKADHTYQNAKTNVKSAFNKGPAEKTGEKIDKATNDN